MAINRLLMENNFMRAKISVVMATHNEENMLAKALDSVKDFADEIIIADGESTDNTLNIAKKYSAKIIKTTNKPNFHINKQMAMDEAKGDLVLQLDADEIVNTKLKKFILKVAADINSQPNKAWFIKRKNFFLGRFLSKGGQYPDPVIRLYINGFARLPQKDVHEQIKADGRVGTAEGHLLHYSNPTFTDYLRKFNTYTSFKASQLDEQKQQISFAQAINFIIWKPIVTFFSLYFRHKGFMDGMAGLIFAIMSGLHHAVAYLKLWELKQSSNAN